MASKSKSQSSLKKPVNDPQTQWTVDDKSVKVDKWDGAAVKNALDDAAKKVFIENLDFAESNGLMDGRLLICTVSLGFAMFALVWDYLHPFPQSRPVLIICVASYFAMMGVLTLYTAFKERGTFAVALEKDRAGVDPDNSWTLASQLKRYDDQYTLYVTFTDGKTNEVRNANFTKSVACFFDENGYMCSDLFEPDVLTLHSSLMSEKKKN